MKKFLAIALFVLGAGLVLAQPKPPAKPVITDAQKAQFFKLQIRVQALQQAQADLSKTIDDMKATCGKDYELQMDKSGDPVCETPAPKTEVKK